MDQRGERFEAAVRRARDAASALRAEGRLKDAQDVDDLADFLIEYVRDGPSPEAESPTGVRPAPAGPSPGTRREP